MPVKEGDTVRVHYILKDANGEVIESSTGSDPIEFQLGAGGIIPGFEKAVAGMEVNEKKSIEISPEDGYGPHDERKVFEYDRANAPQDFNPQVGQTVQLHRPDGQSFACTVLGETEKGFKLDANHPLAGKTLNFDIQVVEIVTE